MKPPGDAIENTFQVQTETVSGPDSFIVTSLILLDVTRMIQGVRVITAVLFRYALTGACLTNNLIEWIVPVTAGQN